VSIESNIVDSLTSLVAGLVYDGVVPQGVEALPRITFQRIGGQALNFVEAVDVPASNAHVQVISWGRTALQASALARQARTALRQKAELKTTVLSDVFSMPYPELGLFGARQDFSFWGA
jgi:hypothetical protein